MCRDKDRLARHRVIEDLTRVYGQQFHRITTTLHHPNLPSDLEVPFTEFGDLVATFTDSQIEMVGTVAIQELVAQRWNMPLRHHPTALGRLREEVQLGKSIVLVSGTGQVERVVSVVAFRLEDTEGHVFVRLCKFDGPDPEGRLQFVCELPGGKQYRQETQVKTVSRLLHSKLKPLRKLVAVTRMHRTSHKKTSSGFSVPTKYLRNEVWATVSRHRFDGKRYCVGELKHLTPMSSVRNKAEVVAQSFSNPLRIFGTLFGRNKGTRDTYADLPKDNIDKLLKRRCTDAPNLLKREAYVFVAGTEVSLYAWLTTSEFEFLQRHTTVLEEWVTSLHVDLPSMLNVSVPPARDSTVSDMDPLVREASMAQCSLDVENDEISNDAEAEEIVL